MKRSRARRSSAVILRVKWVGAGSRGTSRRMALLLRRASGSRLGQSGSVSPITSPEATRRATARRTAMRCRGAGRSQPQTARVIAAWL
jgi:hypothetical protein